MYDDDNNIEKMLRLDSIDKKKTGRGVFNRASRRGYIRGGLKTQSDFLSAKERKKLNGKVIVSNMYEKYRDLNDCDLQEILSHSDSEVKGILTFIKANHSTKATGVKFGVSTGKLYSIFDKYSVEYGKGNSNRNRASIKKQVNSADLINVKQFKVMSVQQKGEYLKPLYEEFDIGSIARYFSATKPMIRYYIKRADGLSATDAHKVKTLEDVISEEIVQQRMEIKEAKDVEVVKIDNSELENKMKELQLQVEHLQSKLNEKSIKSNGLKVELNGVYSKLELENRLLSIATITTDDKSYSVNISLEEVDAI